MAERSAYIVSNFKEIREKKYPDIDVFAEKIDYSKRTVERAQSGVGRLDLKVIRKMAQVLGINEDDIIDIKRTQLDSKNNSLFKIEENDDTSYSKLGMKNFSYTKGKKEKRNVRYMGRTGPIDLEDGDKINKLFFTTDMEKPINECCVDITTSIKESDFFNLVDKLYKKYKDKPLELNGLDESLLPEDVIESLNKKIISLRLGDCVQVRVTDGGQMEIVDFYPKGKLTPADEIYYLIQSLLDELMYKDSIMLSNYIMPIGFEIMDKIIRCSLRVSGQIEEYIIGNFGEIIKLREDFNMLSLILLGVLEEEISQEKAQENINSVHEKIISKIYLLEKLDEMYGFERLTRMYNMAQARFKVNC